MVHLHILFKLYQTHMQNKPLRTILQEFPAVSKVIYSLEARALA